MRQFASTLPNSNDRTFIIRYVANDGQFEYATAFPIKREAYKRTPEDEHRVSEGHTRWVTTLAATGKEYTFDSSRSELVEKLGEDTFSVEDQIIKSDDGYSLRWIRVPTILAPNTESNELHFADVDLDTWDDETESFGRRMDFHFVAGNVFSCALYASGRRQNADHQSEKDMLVPDHIFHKALKNGMLSRKSILTYLGRFLEDKSRASLLLSLRALATVTKIYKLLPDATVSLKVTSKSVCNMAWIGTGPEIPPDSIHRLKGSVPLEKFSALPMDWARTFSCIATFDSGSFSVPPASFKRVMAMSIGDSLYIAAPLLCDPYENPSPFEIRRVRGNVGKPGIALLVPPETTRAYKPDCSDWMFATHAPFDGKLEDSFSTTSLHLSFTGFVLPVDVGAYGCQDSEVYFLESAVSVHDKGHWVADLDIMGYLYDANFRRLDTVCSHNLNGATPNHTIIDHPKLTMIDHWNEVLDRSTTAAIVRSADNWLGRLATKALSLQTGYPTLVVTKEFCWECVKGLWDTWRPDMSGLDYPRGYADQEGIPTMLKEDSWSFTEEEQRKRTDFEKRIHGQLHGSREKNRTTDDILDEMHKLIIIS